MNSGAVRGNRAYPAGRITCADLLAECPFPSNWVTLELSGAALQDAVSLSRAAWANGHEDGAALQLDDEMEVSGGKLASVGGQPLARGRLYVVALDSYLLSANSVLHSYAEEHASRIPPADSGRPAISLLVKAMVSTVWRSLCRRDHHDVCTPATAAPPTEAEVEEQVQRMFEDSDADLEPL